MALFYTFPQNGYPFHMKCLNSDRNNIIFSHLVNYLRMKEKESLAEVNRQNKSLIIKKATNKRENRWCEIIWDWNLIWQMQPSKQAHVIGGEEWDDRGDAFG